MSKAPIYLAGGDSEVRDALRAALDETYFHVVGSFNCHDECATAGELMVEPELIVILALEPEAQPDRGIETLRAVFPDVHIGVVGNNPGKDRLSSCMELGASGYLPWSVSPEALIQSLRLILLGEKMFISGSRPNRSLKPTDRRGSPRRRTIQKAEIVFNDGYCTMDGTILDISDSGAKIRPMDLLNMPSHFELRIKYDRTYQCEVVRRAGFYVGVRFLNA